MFVTKSIGMALLQLVLHERFPGLQCTRPLSIHIPVWHAYYPFSFSLCYTCGISHQSLLSSIYRLITAYLLLQVNLDK